jgi:hypothetical protein
MKAEILTVGDTPWVSPLDEVMAAASGLLKGPLPFDQRALEVPDEPRDDSIRARLADATRQEGKRRHLLKILQRPTPPWNPSDHAELDAEGGAGAWVKKLRREAEQGFEKRTRAKEQG